MESPFRKFRDEAKLSRFKAAIAIGVSPATVQRWEESTTPPPFKHVPGIARAYGVSEDRVLKTISEMGKSVANSFRELASTR